MEIRPDAIIAIVGAGTMGAGIAQVAAAAGHPVRVIDSQAAALARGRETVAKSLASLVRRGTLDQMEQDAILGRIAWSANLADAAGATLAIEAIVERLDVKAALFAELAALVPGESVLASNTSSLSIDAMAASVPGPQRFLGLHFFNPVPAMKLVEVVPGAATEPTLGAALAALMRRWGKHPVLVRDVPGFIVNRVARPYYAEGFAALGDGVSAAAIDHALTAAGGFRMGPLALADLIGHDVNYAVAKSVFDAYRGATRFRPQPAQQALFDGGRLGRKTGTGVYDYAADLPQPAFMPPGPRTVEIAASAVLDILGPLASAARDAGIATIIDTDLPEDVIAFGGIRVAPGDGRLLADRPDISVLLDHARDPSTARTLVITARDHRAAELFAGFAGALGLSALLVPDRPGQIVLRTLAQLANAAADAVADDVAGERGVDEALVYGANHPEGPLAWARRAGRARIGAALANIAQAAGDVMYRPARWFDEQGE